MAEPIGALRVELAATAARFEDDMKRARKAAKDAAGGMNVDFSKIGKSGLSAAKGVATVGVAAAAAAGGIYYLVKQALEAAEAIDDNAKSAGLSVKSYQELGYALSLAGINSDAFVGAMARLAKGIFDAKNGTGALVTAFKDSDPQLLQAVKNAGSVEDAFYAILKAAEAAGPGIKQTGILSAAFGRAAGPDMARVVADGIDSLQQLRAEANNLGLVMSDDLVSGAAEASDQLDRMEKVISIQLVRAVATLAPEITALVNQFIAGLPTLIRWVEEFAQWIGLIKNPNQIQIDAITAQLQTLDSQLRGMRQRILDPDQFAIRSADIQEKIDALKALRDELQNRTVGQPAAPAAAPPPVPAASPLIAAIDPEQKKKIDELVKSLRFEQENLQRGTYEQELYNEVKKAGIKDIDGFLAAHGDLLQAVLDERRAKEALRDIDQQYNQQLSAAQELVNENLTSKQQLAIAEQKLLELKPALVDILGDEEQANEVLAKAIKKVKDESSDTSDVANDLGLTFSSAFEDAIAGGKKFSDILNGLMSDLLKIATRKLITEPLFNATKSLFSDLLTPSAHGNVFMGGRVKPFAAGGVIGGPTMFPMSNGTGLAGEAGPEAIMPLKRIGGDLGVVAETSAPVVSVTIINNSDKKARTEEQKDSRGNREIRVMIGEMVADDIKSGGKIGKAISATYGARRQTMGR